MNTLAVVSLLILFLVLTLLLGWGGPVIGLLILGLALYLVRDRV